MITVIYRLCIETRQLHTGLLLQHSPTSLALYRVRTFNGYLEWRYHRLAQWSVPCRALLGEDESLRGYTQYALSTLLDDSIAAATFRRSALQNVE